MERYAQSLQYLQFDFESRVILQFHQWWLRHSIMYIFNTTFISPDSVICTVRMLDVGDLAEQELGLFNCGLYGLYYYCSVPIRPISVNTVPKCVHSKLD